MKTSDIIVGQDYAVAKYRSAAQSGRGAINGLSPYLDRATVLEVRVQAPAPGRLSWQRDRVRNDGIRVRFVGDATQKAGEEKVLFPIGIGGPWDAYEKARKEFEEFELRGERDRKRAIRVAKRVRRLLRGHGIRIHSYGFDETSVTFHGRDLRKLRTLLESIGQPTKIEAVKP